MGAGSGKGGEGRMQPLAGRGRNGAPPAPLPTFAPSAKNQAVAGVHYDLLGLQIVDGRLSVQGDIVGFVRYYGDVVSAMTKIRYHHIQARMHLHSAHLGSARSS